EIDDAEMPQRPTVRFFETDAQIEPPRQADDLVSGLLARAQEPPRELRGPKRVFGFVEPRQQVPENHQLILRDFGACLRERIRRLRFKIQEWARIPISCSACSSSRCATTPFSCSILPDAS